MKKPEAYFAVHIDAGRDGNGNAKRGWIVFGKMGIAIDFVDEESLGESALAHAGYKGLPYCERIAVTGAVYRDAKKRFK